MKLIIILICLMSERYLVHQWSLNRFYWFSNYINWVGQKVSHLEAFKNQWALLAVVILPILFVACLVLMILDRTLFGLMGFLAQLAIFYYCLGPENPFYPVNASEENAQKTSMVELFFFNINHQMFAVILWFVLLGPIGVFAYRLIYLSKDVPALQSSAALLADCFDWVSARITGLMYLLVGNFQRGFKEYTELFFAGLENNKVFLGSVGILALRTDSDESVSIISAQGLVDHALIVSLVLLALCTMVAWL